MPVMFNMPFMKKFNYTNQVVRFNSCEEVYLIDNCF